MIELRSWGATAMTHFPVTTCLIVLFTVVANVVATDGGESKSEVKASANAGVESKSEYYESRNGDADSLKDDEEHSDLEAQELDKYSDGDHQVHNTKSEANVRVNATLKLGEHKEGKEGKTEFQKETAYRGDQERDQGEPMTADKNSKSGSNLLFKGSTRLGGGNRQNDRERESVARDRANWNNKQNSEGQSQSGIKAWLKASGGTKNKTNSPEGSDSEGERKDRKSGLLGLTNINFGNRQKNEYAKETNVKSDKTGEQENRSNKSLIVQAWGNSKFGSRSKNEDEWQKEQEDAHGPKYEPRKSSWLHLQGSTGGKKSGPSREPEEEKTETKSRFNVWANATTKFGSRGNTTTKQESDPTEHEDYNGFSNNSGDGAPDSSRESKVKQESKTKVEDGGKKTFVIKAKAEMFAWLKSGGNKTKSKSETESSGDKANKTESELNVFAESSAGGNKTRPSSGDSDTKVNHQGDTSGNDTSGNKKKAEFAAWLAATGKSSKNHDGNKSGNADLQVKLNTWMQASGKLGGGTNKTKEENDTKTAESIENDDDDNNNAYKKTSGWKHKGQMAAWFGKRRDDDSGKHHGFGQFQGGLHSHASLLFGHGNNHGGTQNASVNGTKDTDVDHKANKWEERRKWKQKIHAETKANLAAHFGKHKKEHQEHETVRNADDDTNRNGTTHAFVKAELHVGNDRPGQPSKFDEHKGYPKKLKPAWSENHSRVGAKHHEHGENSRDNRFRAKGSIQAGTTAKAEQESQTRDTVGGAPTTSPSGESGEGADQDKQFSTTERTSSSSSEEVSAEERHSVKASSGAAE